MPGLSFASPNWHPSPAGRVPQPRTRLRGMGQDDSGFDWSQFETELPALTAAVTTGTANIIKAENAPATSAAVYNAALTNAQIQAASNPLGAISPKTLLLIGGGLLAFMMMRKEQN